MGWGGQVSDMVTDIFQTGKDVFLQREQTKDYLERQAAAIEGQKVMQETEAKKQATLFKSKTQAMIYAGLALLAIAVLISSARQIS